LNWLKASKVNGLAVFFRKIMAVDKGINIFVFYALQDLFLEKFNSI
jgi:hypothetical protein